MNWYTRMGNNHRTGFTTESLEVPLSLKWKQGQNNQVVNRQISNNMSSYVWNSPIIVDGIVYTQLKFPDTAQQVTCALNLSDGSLLWQRPDLMGVDISGATFNRNRLFVCTSTPPDSIHALNPQNGETIWQVSVDGFLRNAIPVVHENRLYIGTVAIKGDSAVYALNSEDGSLIWRKSLERNKVWIPLSMKDEILFVAASKQLYALSARTGDILWQRQFNSQFNSYTTLAVNDQHIYLSISSGHSQPDDDAILTGGVIALDIHTGNTVWHHHVNQNHFLAPAIHDNLVIVGHEYLTALDSQNGELLWQSDNHTNFRNSAAIIAKDTIFVGSGNTKNISAYDVKTGELLWIYTLPSITYSTPFIADKHLLIGCHDGYLYCFI